jgi:thiol:disulfide interchange protein DsbD
MTRLRFIACLRPTRAFSAWASLLALATAAAFAGAAAAAPVKTEHVEAELVAAKTALAPGEPLTVALRLKMEPGWHTYWQNPGDSGLPTKIKWTLPEGVTAGDIQWPVPHALPVGPLVNYGYDGEVLLLTELRSAAASTSNAPLPLAARADWLVCKEVCIPDWRRSHAGPSIEYNGASRSAMGRADRSGARCAAQTAGWLASLCARQGPIHRIEARSGILATGRDRYCGASLLSLRRGADRTIGSANTKA